MSIPDRQIQLEELLAHQQHLIDALNGIVTDQEMELAELKKTVERLESKVALLSEYVERLGEDLPHEKPPHY